MKTANSFICKSETPAESAPPLGFLACFGEPGLFRLLLSVSFYPAICICSNLLHLLRQKLKMKPIAPSAHLLPLERVDSKDMVS